MLLHHSDALVTVVVTSCERHDLLARTMKSFFEFNTHPVGEVIIVEDGKRRPDAEMQSVLRLLSGIHWLNTGKRIGQIGAIDKAYALVRTPYIFHLEDDWEFYAPGFLEKSLMILEKEQDCLQVWLRAHDDTNGHPIKPDLFFTKGVP